MSQVFPCLGFYAILNIKISLDENTPSVNSYDLYIFFIAAMEFMEYNYFGGSR